MDFEKLLKDIPVACIKYEEKLVSSKFWSIMNRAEPIFFGLLFLAFGLLMYFLNTHTPIIADDFWSAFGPNGRIEGVTDSFEAALNNYMTWGSGVLCFFFQHLFMAYDQKLFDILNTIVFLLLIYVLYLFVVGTFKKIRLDVLIVILFVIFIFPPNFGQDFLWLVGATAYLWTPLISLIYILPLRWQIDREGPIIHNTLLCILYGLLGIVAANTNPNLSAAMTALFGIYVICKLLCKNKPHLWTVLAFAGCFIGFCTVLFSPGNHARAAGEYESVYFVYNFIAITYHLLDWNVFLPIILFPFIVIALRYVKIDNVVIFTIGGFILSHYAMVGAPCYSDRVKVIAIYFGAVLCGYVYSKLKIETTRSRLLSMVCCICMIGSIVHSVQKATYDIYAYEEDNNRRIETILSEKAKGNADVVVGIPYKPISKYNGAYDLENVTEDPNHWVSSAYAFYYGVKTVRMKD